MRTFLGIGAAVLLLLTPSPSVAGTSHASGSEDSMRSRIHWTPVPVDADQQFRGLDATDRLHAWVGGSDGGVWKTRNGGRTWQDVSPRHTKGLLFRDVEILSPR